MRFCRQKITNFPLRTLIALLTLFIAGCSRNSPGHYSDYFSHYYKGTKTLAPTKATSRHYHIKGTKYKPQEHYEYVAEGVASYYGGRDIFHGRPTSTGERFDKDGLTAAHRTLPLPCVVRVTNLENGKSVILKVNDRGPFAETDNRIIDVSQRAALLLGFYNKGTARVRIETCVDDSVRVAKGAPTQVYEPETPSFFGPKPKFILAKAHRSRAAQPRNVKLAYAQKSARILSRVKPQKNAAKKMNGRVVKTSYVQQGKAAGLRGKKSPTPLPSRKSRRNT